MGSSIHTAPASIIPTDPLPALPGSQVLSYMDLLIFFRQFQGIIGILLAFLTFLCYLGWASVTRIRAKTNHNNFNVNKAAPEAAGAWPIVGHLPQLVGPRPLFRILGDMADKYGSIFMVRFGMYPTLVVSSWEMAKECFTTNDRFLANRPASAAGKYLTYNFAMFGFSFYGPYWREIRKISMLELLSHSRLELLKHVPFAEIGSSIKQLYRLWMENQNQNQNKEGDHQVTVDMSQMFGFLTLNTILKLVVGKQEEGGKLYKTIVEFLKLSGVSVASDALPFLGWLDVDGYKRSMKRIAKELDVIAQRWLQEHRHAKLTSKNESCSITNQGRCSDNDFMDVLLSILDGDSNFFNYNRDTAIKATSLALILAGSDTTSTSLTWALALLVTNTSALKKAQEELDMKVGRNRQVEERDIENLVYLQAIVKETLRMYPAAPLAVPHEATQQCTIGGYRVTTGQRVVVNLWKLQHDPRVWPNPYEFKPERFLLDGCNGGNDDGGEAANMDFRGQHFGYIPFGSGRRMCPGVNFAIQIMHMTLARLLHAFEFQVPLSPDENHVPAVIDMAESSGLTMPKVTPLEVLLNPRLPLPLYEL